MRWLEGFWGDIRYAARSLRASPAFTIGAICTLALGMGANTAIFSVVSGVLLRPLPFAASEQLVQLQPVEPDGSTGALPLPILREFRSRSASFASIVAYTNTSKALGGDGQPEQVQAVAGDSQLLATLGVQPLFGRLLREGDDLHTVVVGAALWRRHLGGDPSAVGRSIMLDGESYTIAGIMPEQFQFPYRAVRTEMWLPWDVPARYPNSRADLIVARLKPGIAPAAAAAELSAIRTRLPAPGPNAPPNPDVRVTPLAQAIAGKSRYSLLVLLGAVGVVLLVACGNVANLLLVRAVARAREVAVRAALGASRWRLVRQFLTESLLLAAAAGLLGVAIGSWGTTILVTAAAEQIPRAWEIGTDWRVFVFLLAVCFATGITFGLAPALLAGRAESSGVLLRTRGAGASSAGRLRDALVVAEVAMAFVLLIGAGLLLRTFFRLQSTRTGFAAENVLTLHLTVSPARRQSPEAAALYVTAIDQRVRELPGVSADGFISLLPLQHSNWWGHFSVRGRPVEPPARQPNAELRYITPGYFEALRIPVVRGRGFTPRDAAGALPVVLVNETLARRYFAGEDPVGQVLDRGTIVGVVGDVRQAGIRDEPVPELFYPLRQNFGQIPSLGMTLVVRAQRDPDSLAGAIRAAVLELDPGQPVFNIRTMQRVVSDSYSDVSLSLWLLALFAALALTLATGGIYSVISYTVASRTQEFGIRMALGASAARLLGLVLRRGQLLVGAGLAIGLALSLALTRLLESLLYEVTPTDPPTFAVMSAILGIAGLAACAIPARRAARVDPATALRAD